MRGVFNDKRWKDVGDRKEFAIRQFLPKAQLGTYQMGGVVVTHRTSSISLIFSVKMLKVNENQKSK